MDRRQLLGSVSIFSGLSDKELDQLLQATTTKRLKAKEILFRKGDPGNQLYGILKGALKVMTTATDGKDVMFGLMGPGEVLGEIALLDSEDRSATLPTSSSVAGTDHASSRILTLREKCDRGV